MKYVARTKVGMVASKVGHILFGAQRRFKWAHHLPILCILILNRCIVAMEVRGVGYVADIHDVLIC